MLLTDIELGDVFPRTKLKPSYDVVVGILPSENGDPEFLVYRYTKEGGPDFFKLDEKYLKDNESSLRSRKENPKDSRYYLGEAKAAFKRGTISCSGPLIRRINFPKIYQNITDLLEEEFQ